MKLVTLVELAIPDGSEGLTFILRCILLLVCIPEIFLFFVVLANLYPFLSSRDFYIA
jgi:hypothetical protein